ncbi:GNAT domain-containing protein [Aspergillus filifer]
MTTIMPSKQQPAASSSPIPQDSKSKGMTFQTARLHFAPLSLNDTVALRDLRTSSDVMKWSRQKVIDKNLRETENWIRKMTDEPLLDLETGQVLKGEIEGESSRVERDISETGLSFAVRKLSHVEEVIRAKANAEGGEDVAVPDEIVGVVGIRVVESPLAGNPQFELGYMFMPRTWGKGYASEAVKGIVKWWFSFLQSQSQSQGGGGEGETVSQRQEQGQGGEEKSKEVKDQDGVYAIVAKNNAASLRVMEKCGFSRVNEGIDNEGSLNEIVEFRIGREMM